MNPSAPAAAACRMVCTCGDDGGIRLWSLGVGARCVKTFSGHYTQSGSEKIPRSISAVLCIQNEEGTTRVVSGGADGFCRVWLPWAGSKAAAENWNISGDTVSKGKRKVQHILYLPPSGTRIEQGCDFVYSEEIKKNDDADF